MKWRYFGYDKMILLLYTELHEPLLQSRMVRKGSVTYLPRIQKGTGRIFWQKIQRFKLGKNIRIIVTASRVKLEGSLATYLYGDNVLPLQFEDVQIALAKLKKDTGLDWSQAIVYLLELSSSLSVKRTPGIYPVCFRAFGSFEKNQYRNTTYIQSKNQEQPNDIHVIYDKSLESNLADKVLRIERRLIGNIAKRIGVRGPLYAGQLGENSVWNSCVKAWEKQATKFLCKPNDAPCRTTIRGKKDLYETALSNIVSKPISLKLLEERIDVSKRAGVLNGTNKNNVTKLLNAEIARKNAAELAELRGAIRRTSKLALRRR